MNRNLFLLAAALQLPVALWMQGCGAGSKEPIDEPSKPDEKPGPDVTTVTPSKPETMHKLDTGRDQNERIEKMLSDSRVQWPTDVEHMYCPKTKNPTAHVLFVDTIAERAPKERGHAETKFFGFLHQELVDAFSFEAPKSVMNQMSKQHPAVVSPTMVAEWTKDHSSYVILDSKNHQFVQGSAASFVIAQNVAPTGKDIDQSEWNLVAEVYTARAENKLFAKGNPNNLMTLMVPHSDVPEVMYDISYKAFMMVLFHNVAVNTELSTEQKALFTKLTEADKKKFTDEYKVNTPDIFQYFEDSNKKDVDEAVHDCTVGAVHGVSTNVAQNKKMIEDAQTLLISLVQQFRDHIKDIKTHFGQELPQKQANKGGCYNLLDEDNKKAYKEHGKLEKLKMELWNLEHYSHFEKFVGFALERSDTGKDLLERIRMQLDILYGSTKSYTDAKPQNKNVPKEDAAEGEEAAAEGEEAAAEGEEPAAEGEEAAVEQKFVVAEDWYTVQSHKFEQYPESGDAETTTTDVKFSFRGEAKLAFPNWFVRNLFTLNRKVVPDVGEDWESFAEQTNDDIEKQSFHHPLTDKFVVPEFKFIEALHSYTITDIVLTNPGNLMHSELLLSACLGFFDAMEDMTAKNGITKVSKNSFGTEYVLGEIVKQHNNNNNQQSRWIKNFKGDLRTMGTLKEEHFIKSISFQTLKSQVGVEDIKTIVTKASKEEIVETVVEKVEIKIEEAYQPRSKQSSRTIQPNHQGGF